MVARAPDADLVGAVAVPIADYRQVRAKAEGRDEVGANVPKDGPSGRYATGRVASTTVEKANMVALTAKRKNRPSLATLVSTKIQHQ